MLLLLPRGCDRILAQFLRLGHEVGADVALEARRLAVAAVLEAAGDDRDVEVLARAERPLALAVATVEVDRDERRLRIPLQELLADFGSQEGSVHHRHPVSGEGLHAHAGADEADELLLVAQGDRAFLGEPLDIESAPDFEVHGVGAQSGEDLAAPRELVEPEIPVHHVAEDLGNGLRGMKELPAQDGAALLIVEDRVVEPAKLFFRRPVVIDDPKGRGSLVDGLGLRPRIGEVQDVDLAPRGNRRRWDPVLDRNVARSIAEPLPGSPRRTEAVGAESMVENESSHPKILSQERLSPYEAL